MFPGSVYSPLRILMNTAMQYTPCYIRAVVTTLGGTEFQILATVAQSSRVDYALNGPGSIPCCGKTLSCIPLHPNPLSLVPQWGPATLQLGRNVWGVKLTANLHLVPRLRMMEPYLHALPLLHGVIGPEDNLAFYIRG
jgi:hypothetical protein